MQPPSDGYEHGPPTGFQLILKVTILTQKQLDGCELKKITDKTTPCVKPL